MAKTRKKKSYFFLYYGTFFLAPLNVMKKADKASRVMSDKKHQK